MRVEPDDCPREVKTQERQTDVLAHLNPHASPLGLTQVAAAEKKARASVEP